MKKPNQINRKAIRKAIPYGIMKKIAESAKVSQSVLSQWFNGKFNSTRIEECALREFSKQKRLAKRREERYKVLIT